MRKTTFEMKPCDHCGKTFKSYPHDPGRFCSRSCYWAHRWGTTGKCAQCAKASVTKFCSPSCQRNYWNLHGYHLGKKRRNWERKIALIKELGGKCRACGESDVRVLDVHHIDGKRKVQPKKKQYNWTRRFRDWERNWGNLELLCANCHRRHTWEARGFGKSILP